jgi:two-component system LytT family sensor kinase
MQQLLLEREGGDNRKILLASGRELSKSTLFFVLNSSGWILFAALWSAGDLATERLLPAAVKNLAWAATGFTLTLALRAIYRRIRSTHNSFVAYGVACVLVSTVLTPPWRLAALALMRLGYFALSHSPQLIPIIAAEALAVADASWWISISAWAAWAGMLFMWSSLYFGINAMLDLEAERARVARALKLADTAQLRALQSNLHPHFLFNALNGIATLIREKDVTAASEMVDELSIFLRSTLQRLTSPEIRVAEELQLVDQYLRIQRFRFEDRLHTHVEADPDALGALIPTLILQPLVENALRHGILPREDGGSLCVSVRKAGETLVVSVEDDGPGLRHDLQNSIGLGLVNCKDRLTALYGSAAQLTLGSRPEGGGCAVVIRMPFRRSPRAHSVDPTEAMSL